jgi:hypothetical protein
MKNKHLALDDRLEIVIKSTRNATTISKEVRNHYQKEMQITK